MPDGYDRDREECDPNKRGRVFENGTYRYYRDRENGYVQQSDKFRANGVKIRFDKVSKDVQGQIRSIEDKSGRIDGPKDEKQLKAVRALIEKGVIEHHLLRSVEGEFVSKEAQRLIDGMVQDLGDKFTHQIISRETAREIWAIGLQREAGQQIELPGVREKARQEKAQELQKRREKIAELARARERADKFRRMQQFREAAARGRADAPQRAERARQARAEAVRARQARQTPESAERARLNVRLPNASRGNSRCPISSRNGKPPTLGSRPPETRPRLPAWSVQQPRRAGQPRRNVRLPPRPKTRHGTRRSRNWTKKAACPRWKGFCGWDKQPTRKRQ
ncbi:hypothetical protein OHA40_03265 [Nocardia sp. NBC_00508]|uniref:hypothetical protein n=1 Tax=Nocardia sp. NBC_00508 TaxID=2975992 RepID=UPI002E80E8D0|nr:hypothetical protein [Nocardia sp. NBC_00508]WUD67195.1 hypothetical protein OHA40_03265 [Nocardia sp. NBC_00508]